MTTMRTALWLAVVIPVLCYVHAVIAWDSYRHDRDTRGNGERNPDFQP